MKHLQSDPESEANKGRIQLKKYRGIRMLWYKRMNKTSGLSLLEHKRGTGPYSKSKTERNAFKEQFSAYTAPCPLRNENCS